ncbi:MAG: M3 family metallopeptidase [Planctomycetota bacterium]
MFRTLLSALAPVALAAAPLAQDQDPSPIEAALARADAALEAIASRPAEERTFDNTVRAVDDVQASFFEEARMPGFLAQVSTDPDERAVGRRASADMGNWFDKLYQNEALYLAVKDVVDSGLAPQGEGGRYAERLLRDFRRAGMSLPKEKRDRLAAIDAELNEVGIEFGQNIAEDESAVLLAPEECFGVPVDVLASLPRLSGLYVVEMKGSVVRPFWNLCEVESTRKKLSLTYARRAGQKNVDVLEKMIKLRAEKAQLLGYANTAEYATEIKMAATPDNVWAFYEELRPKLRKKAEQDFEEFQNAKREHTGNADAKFEPWDFSFYLSWLSKEKYAVDREKVREYFPMERVVKGVFDVTQELFGLRFQEITDQAAERGRLIWHEDVKLYEVWDDVTGELLGEFYTDLHPRPGKYTHAAQFPLTMRKEWADGSVTRPLVALVCNFTKPTIDKPALLSHDEVETFFHEFGHCLHSILTEATYSEFSGTSVARDFVEAPSQMLENWIWDANVLSRFAKHYQTGETLPREILNGMIAAKNLGSGLSAEGQVFLGLMDFTYHTDADGELDTTAVRTQVYADTRLFDATPGLYSQAAFGHLNGYHAGYYGYLWSLVYAQDMFSRFKADGIMNKDTAREYRKRVLAKGGTAEALDLVKDFLGRDPSSDAFLRHLGLE